MPDALRYLQNLDVQTQRAIAQEYWSSSGPSDAWRQGTKALLVDGIGDAETLGQFVGYESWGHSKAQTAVGVCNGTTRTWFETRGCQNPFTVIDGVLRCRPSDKALLLAALHPDEV